MAQVRVVGGPHDGETVDSSKVDGHTSVQLLKVRPLPQPFPMDRSAVLAAETTAVHTTYTVRRIRVDYHDRKYSLAQSDFEEIKYLAEATMTDMQAIRHIFETWGPA